MYVGNIRSGLLFREGTNVKTFSKLYYNKLLYCASEQFEKSDFVRLNIL